MGEALEGTGLVLGSEERVGGMPRWSGGGDRLGLGVAGGGRGLVLGPHVWVGGIPRWRGGGGGEGREEGADPGPRETREENALGERQLSEKVLRLAPVWS